MAFYRAYEQLNYNREKLSYQYSHVDSTIQPTKQGTDPNNGTYRLRRLSTDLSELTGNIPT